MFREPENSSIYSHLHKYCNVNKSNITYLIVKDTSDQGGFGDRQQVLSAEG